MTTSTHRNGTSNRRSENGSSTATVATSVSSTTTNASKTSTRNRNSKVNLNPWTKAFIANSQWTDKDEFLDVIYWSRQIVGIVLGIAWGIVPLKGFLAIALFCAMNAGLMYAYCAAFQKIDEEEFGGTWEITKEGFMTSFAGFLVTWIIVYSGLHHE